MELPPECLISNYVVIFKISRSADTFIIIFRDLLSGRRNIADVVLVPLLMPLAR